MAKPQTVGATYRGVAADGLDGTALEVPDTPDNARVFGRPGTVRAEGTLPQLRVLALCELGTRAICGLVINPGRRGERVMAGPPLVWALARCEKTVFALAAGNDDDLDAALAGIAAAVWEMVAVLRRIPEKMHPAVYYRAFRPYIRFFENVVYEGVTDAPVSHRGETGAQSSVVPALVAFLKVPHQPSVLTNHLADMRNFMPAEHRAVLAEVEALPPVRPRARNETFNDLLEGMAAFREVHYRWAELYIHQQVTDPRGTGGTPYRQWLRQLIDETHRWKLG